MYGAPEISFSTSKLKVIKSILFITLVELVNSSGKLTGITSKEGNIVGFFIYEPSIFKINSDILFSVP